MKSVFTKTWIQAVLLLCLAFVVIVILASIALDDVDFADFKRDVAINGELISYRYAAHDVSEWQALLADYTTEFDHRIGGILQTLDETWQPDPHNTSLYTLPIETDPWEAAWQIPGTSQYLWLIDHSAPLDVIDLIEILAPLALVFIIVGVSLFMLSRKIARPVRELTHSSQALASGEQGVRVPADYDEPFGTLANNFNTMADRIERLLTDQQILIGALPHELRGPVSRMRFALDLTRRVDNLPEMQQRISSIDNYLNDLEQILEHTLLLSRLQHAAEPARWASFDLSAAVRETAERFSDNERIAVEVNAAQSIVVNGAEGLIQLATANLITNAMRYANTRVCVHVEVTADKTVVLTVEDDGEGVAQQDRETLFVPFSRTDGSRSRQSGGIGLGLSLVDLIARQHSGAVSYYPSTIGGAGFRFSWPGLRVARPGE